MLDSVGDVVRLFDGIGATPFPEVKTFPVSIPGTNSAVATRVDSTAKEWSQYAAAHGDHLYVLSAEVSRNGGSLVDVYDTRTGMYVGSHELPANQDQIALLPDGRLVTLEPDLLPVLRIWRLPQFGQE